MKNSILVFKWHRLTRAHKTKQRCDNAFKMEKKQNKTPDGQKEKTPIIRQSGAGKRARKWGRETSSPSSSSWPPASQLLSKPEGYCNMESSSDWKRKPTNPQNWCTYVERPPLNPCESTQEWLPIDTQCSTSHTVVMLGQEEEEEEEEEEGDEN